MTLARHVRDSFADWNRTHTGRPIDTWVVNFYTPAGQPDDFVVIVVGLEAHETSALTIRGLRTRIARMCRYYQVGPVTLTVRTLDSVIVAGPREAPARNRPAPPR
jgi:hypothetical protein